MAGRGTLVGRDRETALLVGFLDGAADALVLAGNAGLGKTALWDLAAEMAADRGAVVLRAAPGEGEERYSYAVLNDLLREIHLDGIGLRGPVRDALDGVLLRRSVEGPVDDQLVNVGVHDVLASLGSTRPVVVLVDDTQWADPPSLAALAFAARRLRGSAVRFVPARRAGFDRSGLEAVLSRQDLVYVEPRPLSLDETARLLNQELELTLNPRVLRLVHEQAGGNPLLTLEIGRVLLERGLPEPGRPLEIPQGMAAVLGLRVSSLPEEQRLLLLAVAVDPQLTEGELTSVTSAAAVDGAVHDQLLSVAAGGRVRAWHPLLAAAVREVVTPALQREMHGRLSRAVAHPERRLRHRALSVVDPDDALAGELSAAAAGAAGRGAPETALELAELALARTPPPSPSRPARVLDLASRMAMTGEAQRLTDFLAPEVEAMPVGPDRGRALLLLLDGIWNGVANGVRLVERALVESGDDPEVRGLALDARSFIAGGILVSGVPEARRWAEEAMALRPPPDGEWRHASDALNWCLAHSGLSPRPADGPAYWKHLIWRGETLAAERHVRAALDLAESSGHYQQHITLMPFLSDLVVRSGRVREARDIARLRDDMDLSAQETPDQEMLLAEIEAKHGDAAAARASALLVHRATVESGHHWLRLASERVLGQASALSGDLEAAVAWWQPVHDHVLAAEVREPGMFPVAADLVEGLVLLGRVDEAGPVLAWLDDLSTTHAHPWGTAMVARSRWFIGLVTDQVPPAEAAAGIEGVAADLTAVGLVHDAARAHLLVGSALRRQRQWGLARDQLQRAAAIFEGLGADGWAEICRGDLARVGGRRPAAEGELSPTEREVARLAADGLANKEIARAMNISVSTVETHLTKIYAKLGVQSRARLAGRLDEGPAPPRRPG